jgi:predicted PolB exonuclease-like 3'-5' exonuclease
MMRLLAETDLRSVLVMDIETVSAFERYEELSPEWQVLWDKKANSLRKSEEDSPDMLYNKAAIYAEFGKVVSIGCGVYVKKEEGWFFKVKAFSGDDEALLLQEFADMLNKHFSQPGFRFCAHNGREFDIPYLCRRMLIHGITLPSMLDISGLKPWEVNHLDTMDLWKFGDFKSFVSLNLLALSLGIPSPKDDIDGSQVGTVYWKEKDLKRIDTYCMKDVVTTARVLMKLKGMKIFSEEQIIYGA